MTKENLNGLLINSSNREKPQVKRNQDMWRTKSRDESTH